MSTAALNGRATIFGFIGGLAFTGLGTLFNESGEFSDEFQKDYVQDNVNDNATVIASNRMFKGKLQFTPMAASGTNTLANAATSLEPPAMLAPIVLSSFKWATANSLKWYYAGGWKIAFKKNGVATYEMEIEAHAENNLADSRLAIS